MTSFALRSDWTKIWRGIFKPNVLNNALPQSNFRNSERVKHVVIWECKCIRTFVVILDLAASGSLSSCRPNSWKAMQPASNHSKWSWVMLSKWNTLEWLNSGDNVPVTVLVCVSSFSLNGLYLMYKPLLNLASWTVALRMVTWMKRRRD